MADHALDPFIDQEIQLFREGPLTLPRFKISEMELSVRFVLNGLVTGMYQRENRMSGDIINQVSCGHRVGSLPYRSDIAGQIDIRDDTLTSIQPDGHKELHIPALSVTSVLMDLIQAVAPVLAFQNAAFIMTEYPAQLMAGRIQQPDIKSLPRPSPGRPCTKVPVHHAEIIGTVPPSLRVDIHTADGAHVRIILVTFQQL